MAETPKCADCGGAMGESEAKVFTVCSPCWDIAHDRPSTPAPAVSESAQGFTQADVENLRLAAIALDVDEELHGVDNAQYVAALRFISSRIAARLRAPAPGAEPTGILTRIAETQMALAAFHAHPEEDGVRHGTSLEEDADEAILAALAWWVVRRAALRAGAEGGGNAITRGDDPHTQGV